MIATSAVSMTPDEVEIPSKQWWLIRALDRYGHHDRDCPRPHLVCTTPCQCGFNQALYAALSGHPPIVKSKGPDV